MKLLYRCEDMSLHLPIHLLYTDIKMTSFESLLINRRSCRRYTEEQLTQEEVVTLLQAGLLAPTSKNSQSWQFLAVDDKEKLAKIAKCKEKGASFVDRAPLAIVVLADPLSSDVWIEDASVAASYIQLQAAALGLGSCWVQVRERFAGPGMTAGEYLHEVLNIPLQLQVACIITVGHAAKEYPAHDMTKLPWEKIALNEYPEIDPSDAVLQDKTEGGETTPGIDPTVSESFDPTLWESTALEVKSSGEVIDNKISLDGTPLEQLGNPE